MFFFLITLDLFMLMLYCHHCCLYSHYCFVLALYVRIQISDFMVWSSGHWRCIPHPKLGFWLGFSPIWFVNIIALYPETNSFFDFFCSQGPSLLLWSIMIFLLFRRFFTRKTGAPLGWPVAGHRTPFSPLRRNASVSATTALKKKMTTRDRWDNDFFPQRYGEEPKIIG